MIKKINNANAGIKRPVRVSDLQDIWVAFNKINAISETADPIILSGFYDKGDGYLSEGVIALGGILYYHPDIAGSRIAIGATAYGHEVGGVDQRVFEDSTTQDFSFNMIAKTTVSGVDFGELTMSRINVIRVKGGSKTLTGSIYFDSDAAFISHPNIWMDIDNFDGLPFDSFEITKSEMTLTDFRIRIKRLEDGKRMSPNFNITPIFESWPAHPEAIALSYPHILCGYTKIMDNSSSEEYGFPIGSVVVLSEYDIYFKWTAAIPRIYGSQYRYYFRFSINFDDNIFALPYFS